MDKQRILKEAQQIAKEFSFWMVSGNISHLYGYVYEGEEKKFELEIKFDDNFPNLPPQLIYLEEIKKLLGTIQLKSIQDWVPSSSVGSILQELKAKIEEALGVSKKISEVQVNPNKPEQILKETPETEEYITPDLNAYPSDFEVEKYAMPSDPYNNLFDNDEPNVNSVTDMNIHPTEIFNDSSKLPIQDIFYDEGDQLSIEISTELGLVQQEYAYDQRGSKPADINIYITITLAKTFIIAIDFTDYPKKPVVNYPDEVKSILGDPNQSLEALNKWNSKKPPHIVDILHELEKKLFFIKYIETQSKKISGEYQTEKVADSLTSLNVHLLTYGFKEYSMKIDLKAYPGPPIINLSPDLEQIINIPLSDLNSYKNWIEKESEPVEIVREISWLVDKNSRINFEIDLLKDHYKNIKYDHTSATLNVEMKGKMKTEDLTFDFQIELPIDYPMKMPEVKVVNEFELEIHEKIKNDLHTSFDDFFNKWTPFSYLIDLFNLISKKIFEVSVVSCVICHKIECPSCTKRIAGDDDCHAECPHCNRAYHNHCWEQTIKSFGKCGFCLR